eukprot:11855-Eustigmatos_ZCMA.PRE.1
MAGQRVLALQVNGGSESADHPGQHLLPACDLPVPAGQRDQLDGPVQQWGGAPHRHMEGAKGRPRIGESTFHARHRPPPLCMVS